MNEEMDWDSTPVWEMMALGKKRNDESIPHVTARHRPPDMAQAP